MNETLNRESDRVRTLAEGKPSSEARDELERALKSKHHGVRVIAAQALGRWGGRHSVEALKAAFMRELGSGAHSALRKEYLSALARCYEEEDVPWIMDMHFSEALSWPDAHYIRRELIGTMPQAWVRERVLAEIQSPHPQKRVEAAHALVFTRDPFPGAKAALEGLLNDPVKAVRDKARILCNHPHAV